MESAYSGLMGRRLSSLGRPGWLGSPLKRLTKMLSGPNSSKNGTMPCRSPVSRLDTVTTVVIPITMPRMVRPDRKRLVHTESIAMLKFSAAVRRMSFGPQGDHGIQFRGARRGIPAGDHSHRRRNDQGENHIRRRHIQSHNND